MTNPTNIYNSKGELINNLHTSTDKFILLITEISSDFVAIKNCKFIDSNNNIVDELTTNVVTLYLSEDENCLFSVNGESYHITYTPTNNIPQHYNTIVSNKNLPNNDEILSCIVDTETHMVLGKLLLEFQTILRSRGTITIVEKFLNFVGFKFVDVFTEYVDAVTGDIGLTNNLNSVKTGNYHVFYSYDYQNNNEFDEHNFPKIERDDNVVDFVDILCNAITVAKKYFLIPEQDINFFAVNLITNIGRWQSISSNQTAHYNIDPSYYLNNVETFNIDVTTKTLFAENHIVKDAIEYSDNVLIESHEVKFIPSDNVNINGNIFYVDKEISDDNNNIVDINNFNTKFGNIIHLDLLVPRLYLEYELINVDLPLIKLNKDEKELIDGRYQSRIFVDRPGKYKLTFNFYNEHNNREQFTYFFTVDRLTTKIDFESYSSADISNEINDNNLDIESTLISFDSNNGENKPIHGDSDFSNLIDYFSNDISNINKYTKTSFTDYNRYVETKFNPKFRMIDNTNMPIKYINNFLSISFYTIVDDAFTLDIVEDSMHIFLIMEIVDNPNHVVVMNKHNGITNDLFFSDNPMVEHYETIELPVNYDFDVIFNDGNNQHFYESLYTRLKPLNNANALKLNDIFYCRPNTDSVINFTNVTWRVYENISKRLVHEHNGYSLKFRIFDKNIYDVEMEIEIAGNINKVYKEKCLTSFNVII